MPHTHTHKTRPLNCQKAAKKKIYELNFHFDYLLVWFHFLTIRQAFHKRIRNQKKKKNDILIIYNQNCISL